MTSLREAWQTKTQKNSDARKNMGPPPASAPVEMNVGPPHIPRSEQTNDTSQFLAGVPTYSPSFQSWPAEKRHFSTEEEDAASAEQLTHVLQQIQKDENKSLVYAMQGIVADTEAYLQQKINQVKQSVDKVKHRQDEEDPPASNNDFTALVILSSVCIILLLILFGISLYLHHRSFKQLHVKISEGLSGLTAKCINFKETYD